VSAICFFCGVPERDEFLHARVVRQDFPAITVLSQRSALERWVLRGELLHPDEFWQVAGELRDFHRI